MFEYVVPKIRLTLQEVGAIYQIDWARSGQRKNTITPIYGTLVAQRDNHVKAWLQWKKEQEKKQQEHLRDLQRQDDLDAAMFREEQQRLLQNNKETARRAVIEKQERQEYDTLVVTTWYGLLHYDYLTRRTGPFIFFQPT